MYTDTLGYKLAQLVATSPACTIQLMPSTDEHIFSHIENGVCEIGLSKRCYLAMFSEAHTYWHNKPPTPQGDLEVYYRTFGFMLTTNENHTVVQLHETLFQRLVGQAASQTASQVAGQAPGAITVEMEFKLIAALLTSRLKRINKSSSLWLWMKKLSVMYVFGEHDEQTAKSRFTLLIDCVSRAQELHFANYYASNYLRWCVRLVRASLALAAGEATSTVENVELKKWMLDYITNKLVGLCHRDLVDVSLWSTLAITINGRTSLHEREAEVFVVEEAHKIARQYHVNLGFLPKLLPEAPVLTIRRPYTNDEMVKSEIAWLVAARCKVVTPYVSMFLGESSAAIANALTTAETELENMQRDSTDTMAYANTAAYVDCLNQVSLRYGRMSE